MQQIAPLLSALARGVGKLWGKGCIGKVIVGILALIIIGICAAPFRGASQTTPVGATAMPAAQVAATTAPTEPPAPTRAPQLPSPTQTVATVPTAQPTPTNQPTATEPLPTAAAQPAAAPTPVPVPTARPKPTIAPKPSPVPASGVRIGAICRDGTRSSATGRGACSHHGGVDHWLYK
jgi:hypothetical protein